MRKMSQLIVLLRVRAELPAGLDTESEEFREGWKFVRTGSTRGGEEKIRMRGWHFIGGGGESPQDGADATFQHRRTSALNRALRLLGEIFNAAKAEPNRLTRNPWFSQATLIVHPYLIQRSRIQPAQGDAQTPPHSALPKRLPVKCTMVVAAVLLRDASASADLG